MTCPSSGLPSSEDSALPDQGLPQGSERSADQRLLTLALAGITAPVLAGLVLIQAAERWLQSVASSDHSWWTGSSLPPLDPTTIQQRSQTQLDPPDHP